MIFVGLKRRGCVLRSGEVVLEKLDTRANAVRAGRYCKKILQWYSVTGEFKHLARNCDVVYSSRSCTVVQRRNRTGLRS